MTLRVFAAVIFSLLLSCNSGPETTPTSDVDVARTFIRNILDADFKEAEQYILKDEINQQYFERFKATYNAKDKTELEQFKSADIIVNEISNPSDTITIVNYSNSFRSADKSKLKMVRINDKWVVDLKYTFSGNL